MEKSLPLLEQPQAPQPGSRRPIWRILSVLLALVLGLNAISHPVRWTLHKTHAPSASLSECPQPEPLTPSASTDALDKMWDILSTPAYENASIVRHSGAVQVDTQSYDDMGPIDSDPRWKPMGSFAAYLAKTFPLLHERLTLEKVNTYGLLYTWQGSDEELKPLLLMAHQDVVPVPDSTVDAWTHPPFSGYYDGKYIWGRGSSDCKNQLIAVMESVEALLEAGFEPKRTVVLSFGFDEEISGREGAGHLAPFLFERYGKDGIAAIVDEGATFSHAWGQLFALPGVGEKGYTDVIITIRMPGGHSSIPSDHTSIGVLSEIVTAIESTQYSTYLASENPFLGLLQCGASHAPSFPKKLKKLLGKHSASTCNKHKGKSDHLALEAAKLGKSTQYLMQTSQAVDVVTGGVKVNALPERTSAIVNHRINIGDTPETVWDHVTSIAKPVAEKYNLTLHAFDGTKEAPLSISLTASETTLQVAPVTPTENGKTPYGILAGTVQAIYKDYSPVVAPGIMTGNTDTRYYWDVSKHIFRFGPGYDPEADEGLGFIHTVNERVSVKAHINMVKWFVTFVRNMDEAELE